MGAGGSRRGQRAWNETTSAAGWMHGLQQLGSRGRPRRRRHRAHLDAGVGAAQLGVVCDDVGAAVVAARELEAQGLRQVDLGNEETRQAAACCGSGALLQGCSNALLPPAGRRAAPDWSIWAVLSGATAHTVHGLLRGASWLTVTYSSLVAACCAVVCTCCARQRTAARVCEGRRGRAGPRRIAMNASQAWWWGALAGHQCMQHEPPTAKAHSPAALARAEPPAGACGGRDIIRESHESFASRLCPPIGMQPALAWPAARFGAAAWWR